MSLLGFLFGPEKAKVVLRDFRGTSVTRFMVGNQTPLEEVNSLTQLHYNLFKKSEGPRTLVVSYGGIRRELYAEIKGVIYSDEVHYT